MLPWSVAYECVYLLTAMCVSSGAVVVNISCHIVIVANLLCYPYHPAMLFHIAHFQVMQTIVLSLMSVCPSVNVYVCLFKYKNTTQYCSI